MHGRLELQELEDNLKMSRTKFHETLQREFNEVNNH